MLLASHLAFSVWPALTTIRNDFANYYVSARLVRDGRPLDRLYDRDWFQNEVRRAGIARLGGFTSYPPANALLLVPLTGMGPAAAKAAWTALLAGSLVAAFLVLRSALPSSAWLLAFVFLLPSSALSNALVFGQPYPVLLLLLCLSFRALLRGRAVLSGALLAPVAVLKLYGLPFLLYFAWTRRWRSVAGFVAGAALLTAASVAVLGLGPHEAYVREALPMLLRGELLDPYSTVWQTLPSLAHRLFQLEPDLNPAPVADIPALAVALSRALPVTVTLVAVLAGRPEGDGQHVRREWAVLTLAALAASPVTASYHFLLLVLPASVLCFEWEKGRRVALLAALAFVASPVPFLFDRFASGWENLLACPRLLVLLGLVAAVVRPRLSPGRLAAAALGGTLLGVASAAPQLGEPWARVSEARGGLLAEPVACEGGLSWVTYGEERLVVRATDGRVLRGEGDTFLPRCAGGRLLVQRSVAPGAAGDPTAAADRDETADGRVLVFLGDAQELRERDRATGAERVLAKGRVRWPRISPEAAWVAYQSWEGDSGSWDIFAVERSTGRVVRVTSAPSNEKEPSWMPGGERIVFASDRRRGLGYSALYTTPFRP